MVPEWKVSYKVKWSPGDPVSGSLNIIEPTQDEAIARVSRIIRRNVLEHYPQIIEINAEQYLPQGTILPLSGSVVAGRNDGMP